MTAQTVEKTDAKTDAKVDDKAIVPVVRQRIAAKLPLPEIKVDVKAEAARALYVGAGAGDLAVDYVKGAVSGVSAKVATVERTPAGVVAQAKGLAEKAAAQAGESVGALGQGARARRDKVTADVTGKVSEAVAVIKNCPSSAVAAAESTAGGLATVYRDLAARGEDVVSRLRAGKTAPETVAPVVAPAPAAADVAAPTEKAPAAEKAVAPKSAAPKSATPKPAAPKPAAPKKETPAKATSVAKVAAPKAPKKATTSPSAPLPSATKPEA